jgi:hypothetical protein
VQPAVLSLISTGGSMKAANDNFTKEYDAMLEKVRIAMTSDQGSHRLVEAYKGITQRKTLHDARKS